MVQAKLLGICEDLAAAFVHALRRGHVRRCYSLGREWNQNLQLYVPLEQCNVERLRQGGGGGRMVNVLALVVSKW